MCSTERIQLAHLRADVKLHASSSHPRSSISLSLSLSEFLGLTSQLFTSMMLLFFIYIYVVPYTDCLIAVNLRKQTVYSIRV